MNWFQFGTAEAVPFPVRLDFIPAAALSVRGSHLSQETRWAPIFVSAEAKFKSPVLGLGLHIRPQNRVDPRLVAGGLAKPTEQVGVEAHGHNFFGNRHHYFCAFPECSVGGVSVGIGRNAFANGSSRSPAKPVPICAGITNSDFFSR
jgi:hypothetical protein